MARSIRTRRSTRRLSSGRGKKLFKKIASPLLLVFLVVTAALIWGSYLKAQSDALAQAEAEGEWWLDEETASPIMHVKTPELRAGYAAPGGTLRQAEDASYGGVTIPLGSCAQPLPYTLDVAEGLDLTFAQGAPSLAAHVSALKSNGLYVIGVFEVTTFDTSDVSLRAYRKGLETALLSLFAQTGIDDILLVGLPAGDDNKDLMTATYVNDIKETWATLPVDPPVLGVALTPSAFQSDINQEDGSPIYAGQLSPGRILSACDYLSLDLRGYGASSDDLLKDMQYAYVRYSLRLLLPISEYDTIVQISKRGFERILEYGR